jgi:hypothetical protein
MADKGELFASRRSIWRDKKRNAGIEGFVSGAFGASRDGGAAFSPID